MAVEDQFTRSALVANQRMDSPLIAAAVIAVCSCFPALASQPQTGEASMSKSRQNTVTPTPSPLSVWSGVMKILQSNSRPPDKLEIERAIGLQFSSVKEETSPATIGAPLLYSGGGETEALGMYKLTLYKWPTRSRLIITWTPSEGCVQVNAAKQQLIEHGWTPAGPRPTNPESSLWNFFPMTRGPHRVGVSSSFALLTHDQLSPCVEGVIADLFETDK